MDDLSRFAGAHDSFSNLKSFERFFAADLGLNFVVEVRNKPVMLIEEEVHIGQPVEKVGLA
jgi:hypothetical protein